MQVCPVRLGRRVPVVFLGKLANKERRETVVQAAHRELVESKGLLEDPV